MSSIDAVLAVVAALIVGYWLGRARPIRALDDWMWCIDPERHTVGWWAREAYAGVVIALHPVKTVRALRERRRKPSGPVAFSGAMKPKLPAPKLDPNWAKESGE